MDAPELMAEYHGAQDRFIALLRTRDADQEASTVAPCPAWTVHDLVSHVVSMPVELSASRYPDGDPDPWIQALVADRRATSIDDQVDEWLAAGPAIDAMFEVAPELFSPTLLVDMVSHEHDLAGALDTRSDRASSGLVAAIEGSRPTVDADLARHGLGAMRLVDGDRSWIFGAGDVGLEVRASTFELFRLMGGRRSLAQLAATDHDGDLTVHLPGLVHLDPPETDLVE